MQLTQGCPSSYKATDALLFALLGVLGGLLGALFNAGVIRLQHLRECYFDFNTFLLLIALVICVSACQRIWIKCLSDFGKGH